MNETDWSEWRPFPDPRKNGFLTAPLGPGCYEIRHRGSDKPVLFGMGNFVALRMTSLLPKPFGTGTRKNQNKRAYVLEHIDALEYRTMACGTIAEAKHFEKELKAKKTSYTFKT